MDAKQVPLRELLASIPEDARLVIDDADGKGTRFIPVGRLCQEAAAALAEPVQEQPVCDECGRSKRDGWALYCVDCLEPMFAQRKPLTDEGINALELPPSGTATVRDLVRLIERAHGIGGQDE